MSSTSWNGLGVLNVAILSFYVLMSWCSIFLLFVFFQRFSSFFLLNDSEHTSLRFAQSFILSVAKRGATGVLSSGAVLASYLGGTERYFSLSIDIGNFVLNYGRQRWHRMVETRGRAKRWWRRNKLFYRQQFDNVACTKFWTNSKSEENGGFLADYFSISFCL